MRGVARPEWGRQEKHKKKIKGKIGKAQKQGAQTNKRIITKHQQKKRSITEAENIIIRRTKKGEQETYQNIKYIF